MANDVRFFTDDNEFSPPSELSDTQEGRATITKMLRLRLLVAAELCRCGIIHTLDGVLDDADTVVGVLDRLGVLDIASL